MSKLAARLKSDDIGATAIIFALVVVAIIGIVGLAFDMQRMATTDVRLQSALDASALAGARTLEDSSRTDAQIKQVVQDAFSANMLTGHKDVVCATPNVDIDRVQGRVKVDSDCELKTTVANIVGVEKMSLTNESAARAAITKLDVALMLDVSGSMGGSKLDDLKAAAGDAIDTLITGTAGERVRIGFNSYSTSVNPGDYLKSLLDIPYGLLKKQKCVSERVGPNALTDAAPGPAAWLGHKATDCPKSSIEPLTSDADMLKSEINKFKSGGTTAGHLGVAWAWYIISPEWADVWPEASRPHEYDEENTLKSVILMTDGEFNAVYHKPLGDSSTQAVNLCNAMRDKNIIIYAVVFDTKSKSARDTMKACAGDEDRYFEAKNGSELKAAYQKIASQLTNLSLTE